MSRNSRLWHPYQNDTVAFGGGWYDTLHHGYIGYVNLLEQEHYEWIRDKLPGITRLNIMFDCYNNYSAIEPTIERLISLILQYAPRLVSFRLWACGPVFLFWSTSEWYSVLKNVLILHIFDALQWMTRLEILWLDLDDIPVEDFPSGMQTSPTWSLEDQLNARVPLLNLCALREFRFASTHTDPYHMIVHRLPQFGALQQIHIAKEGFTHEWVTLQPDFARRFHEIGVIMDQAAIGNLVQFFAQFNALTRIGVELRPDGPRFLELFRALLQTPNLQVLTVAIVQVSLFNQEDINRIFHNRPAPLLSLQILDIHLHTTMESCAQISVEPLFENPIPGRPPYPMPNLKCFEMTIKEGSCLYCYDQDDCIKFSVNRWFKSLESIIFLKYSNLVHDHFVPQVNDDDDTAHRIGGYLSTNGRSPPPSLPIVLHNSLLFENNDPDSSEDSDTDSLESEDNDN